MTLVDLAALTAALAERDAARAEVARLRAAVEGVAVSCHVLALSALANGPVFDAYMTADRKIRATLAATEDQP